MKKFFLAVFILLDISIMAAAGYFLYAHMTQRTLPFGMNPPKRIAGTNQPMPVLPATVPVVSAPAAGNSLIGSSTTATAPMAHSLLMPPSSVATTAIAGVRHIGFKYRNSKAHKVDIKADFTQWKSEAMTNANGTWNYMATLPPGEYEYCFIVDDNKGIRDPTNKRIKQIGTTYVSAIVVPPLSVKPK